MSEGVSALFSALAVSGVLAAWPAPQAAVAGLREAAGHSSQKVPDFPTMGAWLRAFIPTNPIEAAAETNMAPLVVFALLFGLALTRIRAELRRGLTDVFQALMDTIRRYDVHWWCSQFLDTLAETESRESGTPWLRL